MSEINVAQPPLSQGFCDRRAMGDLLGYARASTTDQQPHLQVDALEQLLDQLLPGGKLVFHVFAALAEFERDLIRERTSAGLAAASARGRRGGRLSVLTGHKLRVRRRCMHPGSTPLPRSPRPSASAAPRSTAISLASVADGVATGLQAVVTCRVRGARPPHVPSTALALHHIVAAQPPSKLEAEWSTRGVAGHGRWRIAGTPGALPAHDVTQNPAAPATETSFV
jgi:hypothetical protein